jgi:selenocysteine lyase/cysteine desulfurase
LILKDRILAAPSTSLESYFSQFRKHIIGIDLKIKTPYHDSIQVVYADWIASGRNYALIEDCFRNDIMPYVANTHTETNSTGMAMTLAYKEARNIIKAHVNACQDDVLISSNSGMTGVINKFQRILGLKIDERLLSKMELSEENTPVIFITHMEHHSNQTSWLETIADVEIIHQTPQGLVDLDHFHSLLAQYKNRKRKIAAVTSCSNVTGIFAPYFEIAKIIHKHGGHCFVDFACSAPYIDINMHPDDPEEALDAIYFSPHKFLGGPGSSGILIFHKKFYKLKVPDNPGGGTVEWTNPWGEHKYIEDIEIREDGGTPAFLQTMKVALSLKLKEEMGTENIHNREKEQMDLLWPIFDATPNLNILAALQRDRLGVFSFYINDLHYNLAVKILNDRFGIQTRGGCSCAGTYGHYLLHVEPEQSYSITCMINQGDYSTKPGWIRMSIHPTMTDEEIIYIGESIKKLAENHEAWSKDYAFDKIHGEILYKDQQDKYIASKVQEFFNIDLC